MYGADISPSLILRVTDAVIEQIVEWQSHPLESIYPIIYLDCIAVKICQDQRGISKAVYLALGVHMGGRKELMGLRFSENEASKFWLSVLTDLQNWGLKDILIASVDGLKGFPNTVNSVFPQTKNQLCIVHMARNLVRYAPWKDYKPVTADLKRTYHSATEEEACLALDQIVERWNDKYLQISRTWRAHWENFNTLFDYSPHIRKVTYTTNAIESLNSVICKTIRKVNYLTIQDVEKKWTMPIRSWNLALNRFIKEFQDRLTGYM